MQKNDWILIELWELGVGKNAIVDGPFGSNLKVTDYIDDPINGIPVLTTKNLEGDYSSGKLRYIRKEKFLDLKRSEVKGGDILVAKIGSVGKTGIYPSSLGSALIPANLLKFTVTKLVELKFVYCYLQSESFQKCIREITSATAQPAFNVTKFRYLKIPLPPLSEQHRIVAKIEELFSDLDAGIASLKKAKEQLKTYYQSVLKRAFEGGLTKEWREKRKSSTSVEWNEAALREVLAKPLINGRSVPTKKDGFPVLRLTAIRGKFIDESQTKDGDWTGFNPETFMVHENDFLVSRGNGTLELVGRGAVVRKEVKVAFPDTMIRIRLKGSVSLDYFYWIWRSRLVRNQIEKHAKTTAGIYKINQGSLEKIKFPLMSIDEQVEIVTEIESRISEAENLEKTLDAALAQAESLRQSILKQAFEGKLVPQDPKDEPAEKLLERIRAERAANEEIPKKRGRYGGGVPGPTQAVAARNETPVEGGAPKPRRGRPPGKKATAA